MTGMAAVTIDAIPPRTGPGWSGPGSDRRTMRRGRSPATAAGPDCAVLATAGPGRPAAAEVWSGWVGIAHRTGFGMVSPLPGIWPSLHLDTSITLPIGVEAYAAYALRAWLDRDRSISARTRRFAKWSAICSFALGMAGQVAYHLIAQAGMTRAPWPVTTLISCLPVLVLAMGTTLAHMLRAEAADTPDNRTEQLAVLRPLSWSPQDQDGPRHGRPEADRDWSARQDRNGPAPGPRHGHGIMGSGPRPAGPRVDQARTIARRLAATGRPVSRRALRRGGVTGSNESLNALARMINAELTGCADSG